MSGWWMSDMWQNGQSVELVSWVWWVIFSICLHELGHGVAAIWEGDDTPIRTGHMTWNPLVHMGGLSLLLFALVGFAWGLMPVNPSNFRHRRWGDAIVALAGPLVNLVLAIILLTGSGLWNGLVNTSPDVEQWKINVGIFLLSGGWLNLILLALNLLPFPPLDGSRILASFSWKYRQLLMNPNIQLAGMGFIMIFFWFTPLGSQFIGSLARFGVDWSDFIARLVSSS